MKPQEDHIRQILDELGKALLDAIQESSQMNATVRRIRREGYDLHLMLGCLEDSQAAEKAAEPKREPPGFRITAEDVHFLKSIGIDPTRSVRRRRKPQSLA